MYGAILIPVADDVPARTDAAIATARALLAPGGTLTLLHVLEHIPAYVETYIPETLRGRAHADAVEMLAGIAARDGGGPMRQNVSMGHGAGGILDFAKAHDIDCIVISSHRPEFQDVFFGSTAASVVRHAPCSVHVLR